MLLPLNDIKTVAVARPTGTQTACCFWSDEPIEDVGVVLSDGSSTLWLAIDAVADVQEKLREGSLGTRVDRETAISKTTCVGCGTRSAETGMRELRLGRRAIQGQFGMGLLSAMRRQRRPPEPLYVHPNCQERLAAALDGVWEQPALLLGQTL